MTTAQLPEITKVFERVPDAHPDGGWKFNDEEQIAIQRGVVWDLIKQMGQNLTQGQSLINITMPVTIFEPRSYLERISDSWCYAPIFLTKAAQETDPVERIKNVATFAFAGLSNTCSMRKPFNPILGETYQAYFDDGTQVLCEQSSHHPPISNWQVFGPDNLYHFYGYGEWAASFRANAVKGQQKGTTVVEFKDGGVVSFTLPEIWLRGIMFGERVVEYDGPLKFRDEINKIGIDIFINPPQNASWGASWGWSKRKYPTDYAAGIVFKTTSSDMEDETARTVIGNASGTWLGCLEFDDKTYWDFQLGLPKFTPKPVDDPLPSDSRFREDLVALAKGDIEEATKWKTALENKQRREAKLRKTGADKRKAAESPAEGGEGAPPPAAASTGYFGGWWS